MPSVIFDIDNTKIETVQALAEEAESLDYHISIITGTPATERLAYSVKLDDMGIPYDRLIMNTTGKNTVTAKISVVAVLQSPLEIIYFVSDDTGFITGCEHLGLQRVTGPNQFA